MVFQLVLAAHHAATASAHKPLTQKLDGSGSGCGPFDNNCSTSGAVPPGGVPPPGGPLRQVGRVPPPPPRESAPMTYCGKTGFGCHDHLRNGYFGKNTPLPGNHRYSINPSRDGSEQNVHLLPHSGTTGYSTFGNVFHVHGEPGTKSGVGHAGSYANSMLGPNPKVTVPHGSALQHGSTFAGGIPGVSPHAFGSASSSANAMFVPASASAHGVLGSSQASFFGHHKAFEFHHPMTEKKVLPEQILEPSMHGTASHAANLAKEAKFVSGQSASHVSPDMNVANSLERAHASTKTKVDFITSHHFQYNGGPGGPGNPTSQPYGVAYATQTQRLPPGHPSGLAGQQESYHQYAMAIQHHTAASGSAASMTGKPKKKITQLEFCDLFPDRCYFAPAPETQGIAGVYHSI